MKTLLVLVVIVATAAEAQTAGTIRRLDGSRISVAHADSLAAAVFAREKVTGAQVALVDDGKLVWWGAYGLRRRDPLLPMDNLTTMWAASITKAVFATYVMQLVERGEFNLDVPVAKQLSKPLNDYAPYKETASLIVGDSMWPTITPRMLLAHTSGLRNFPFVEPDGKMHLHFKPGTKYQYSGDGINLVQFVIEQQKGKSLDTLMADAIFRPLGMTRTNLIYKTNSRPTLPIGTMRTRSSCRRRSGFPLGVPAR